MTASLAQRLVAAAAAVVTSLGLASGVAALAALQGAPAANVVQLTQAASAVAR